MNGFQCWLNVRTALENCLPHHRQKQQQKKMPAAAHKTPRIHYFISNENFYVKGMRKFCKKKQQCLF